MRILKTIVNRLTLAILVLFLPKSWLRAAILKIVPDLIRAEKKHRAAAKSVSA